MEAGTGQVARMPAHSWRNPRLGTDWEQKEATIILKTSTKERLNSVASSAGNTGHSFNSSPLGLTRDYKAEAENREREKMEDEKKNKELQGQISSK